MKPSTLASGVRSSCETMLTSSVFIRSLSRSSAFCCSSSAWFCSMRSAMSLNAWVSSPISPGPCGGSRSDHSPPASRVAPEATARTGRPIAARQEHAEENDQRRRGADSDRADDHGQVGASLGVAGCVRGKRVLGREEAIEDVLDRVGVPLPFFRNQRVPADRGFVLHHGYERLHEVEVLPDPLLHLLGPPALHRVVGDE